MKTLPKCLLLAATALLVAVTAASAATLVYEQPFNRPSNGYIYNIAGWNAWLTSSAVPIVTNNSGNLVVQNSTGTGDGSNGRIYDNFSSVSGPHVIVGTGLVDARTEDIGLDLSEGSYEIAFDTVQSATSGHVQLLVQVEENWYISTRFFDCKASDFTSTTYENYHQTFVFTTDAAAWSAFTLVPSTGAGTEESPHNGTLAIGASLNSNLPSTTITGIGFYLTNTSSSGINIRIDTLTVTQLAAVPEPATTALILGGALLLGITLRRLSPR
jgi:hypothetical protein